MVCPCVTAAVVEAVERIDGVGRPECWPRRPRGVLIVIVKKVLGHDVGEVAARQLIDHPRNLGHGGVKYPVVHDLGDPAFGRSTAQR